MAPGGNPDPSSHLAFMATEALDINTELGCSKATDPDMAFGSSLGPVDTMFLDGSTGHSDWHDPGNTMSLRSQHDYR